MFVLGGKYGMRSHAGAWERYGLGALTLLVAESDPKEKDSIIHLIMNLLSHTA